MTDDDAAAYLRIAEAVREAILSGRYQVGDRLPSESDLIKRYDVSRGPVRQAIARLKQEGLVSTRAGAGAFVRRTPPCRRLSTDRFARAHRERGKGAYDVELRDLGYQGRTEWLQLGRDDCPPEAAELLGVEPGAPVMVRARLMFAAPLDGDRVDLDAEEVMQVATSYIPWDLAEAAGVTGEDTGVGGLYSRLEDAGRRLARFVEKAKVRVGTAEECERLGLDDLALVLTLDRQAFADGGQVVEICRHVMPPTYYELVYEFPAS